MQPAATSPFTCPLPEGWSTPTNFADTILADGLKLRRAALSVVSPDGQELTGAAAQRVGDPYPRARFELIERVATFRATVSRTRVRLRTSNGRTVGLTHTAALFPQLGAGQDWRLARSNGVALHSTWADATFRALCELAERDRLLRSWWGEFRPERIEPFAVPETEGAYDWHAYAFPEPNRSHFSAGFEVVAVIGFPRDVAPFVFGFSARPTIVAALEAAESEAMQLLAFLWGEPVPASAPPMGPSAMHHLEWYQWASHRASLHRWLAGEHAPRGYPAVRSIGRADVTFADLTAPWIRPLFVAKAVAPSAALLAFGEAPFSAHLPADRRIHPIA